MRPLPPLLASWVLVGLYASCIFLLSSLSSPPLMTDMALPHLDKVYHFLEYAGLTFLLIRALHVTYPTYPSTRLSLWGFLVAVHYGALDELHQGAVPGRMMSVLDMFADVAGASVMAGMWRCVHRRWPILLRQDTYR